MIIVQKMERKGFSFLGLSILRQRDYPNKPGFRSISLQAHDNTLQPIPLGDSDPMSGWTL